VSPLPDIAALLPRLTRRGHVVNTVRESLFQAVYFGVYEHIKSYLAEHLPRNVAVPVAGGLSGAAGWFFSYPLDCIRTNIQVCVAASMDRRGTAMR
jgi:hypothetical protein